MEYYSRLDAIGITLRQNGKQTCPKCSASRKNKTEKCLSVTFSDNGVLYKCHNCGWQGIVPYRVKEVPIAKVYRKPNKPEYISNKEKLYRYFEKRSITRETVDYYNIETNSRNDIIFQYFKNGELVNVKYRRNLGNGKKQFRQEEGTEKTLFGMDIVSQNIKDNAYLESGKTLIWVEGEIDVLSCFEYGLFAVSVPQGASENKLECIENCWDFINQFDTHIIAVDNDAAGDKLKLNLLNRLGKNKCKIVDFGRYKDANEVISANDDLLSYFEKAQYIAPEGIETFSDALDEIIDFKENGYTKGYSTGWSKLDEIFTIKKGYLMITTGYPSRGKSFFCDNLSFNLAARYDLKILSASFETTSPVHFGRLAAFYSGKKLSLMEEDEFNKAFSFINEHFYRFTIDRFWTVDEIIEKAELSIKKYGIDVLYIDPYNRINNVYEGREDKYIGSILAKLSMFAKKNNVFVMFVAHPKKPDSDDVPTMYSISGSGDWYNMADYGVIVHRNRCENGRLDNRPQIHVAKVKDFNLGDPSGGIVQLVYDTRTYSLKE